MISRCMQKINEVFEKGGDDYIISVEELSKITGYSKGNVLLCLAENHNYKMMFDYDNYNPESGPFISKAKNKIISNNINKNKISRERVKKSKSELVKIRNRFMNYIQKYYKSWMNIDKNMFEKINESSKTIDEMIEYIGIIKKND